MAIINTSRALPRIYDSSDDLAFDEENISEEETRPGIDPEATGIRSFFASVVDELEDTQPFVRIGGTR